MLPGFLTLNTASILLFLLVIAAVLWRDRENLEFHKILVIRRTDRGIDFLDRTAKRYPRFWRWWSNIGVIVGLVAMVLMFALLFKNALQVLFQPEAMSGVGLVLPTTSTQASVSPGVFFIPFWYWIIGISSVAVVHELMHGVIGRNEGFPIKSVGWFILGIIPGAFVEPEGEEMLPDNTEESEPDEEDDDDSEGFRMEGPWGDGDWRAHLRVLAAGSWSNLTVAGIVLLLLAALTTGAHGPREVRGLYDHQGVEISKLYNNSPAQASGFEQGMVVTQIQGTPIKDLTDFSKATGNFTVNETISMTVERNSSTRTIEARLGIWPEPDDGYRPAPADPLLVRMEKSLPGTITAYEKLNDPVIDSDLQARVLRWKWIRDNYPDLEERATARIKALDAQQEPEPFLGIGVVPEREVKPQFEGLESPLNLLLQLLGFLLIIHAGIGAFNLLPLKPLDGGWMMDILLNEFKPDWRKLTQYVSGTAIFLLLLNIGVPMLL